ncbi:MAG: LysR family transcriptional regulator [Acidobacteriaceae bacterium]|nr:LysR family transcriptional regulator [Acidobacteriaceae bacterium]
MDTSQVKLFKDIATARSVSRGAGLNKISQSAASQYLQDLEESLGVVLLDRSTRPLNLTDAGRRYLDFCRDVIRRHDQLQSELDEIKGKVEGMVRIASIYSVGLSELSHLERDFYRRYPDATLEIDYLRPEKVYEAVLADKVDFGLVSYPEADRQVTVIPWREEQMVLAVSPYHSLAKKTEIVPADLNGVDFVAFDDDLPIRRNIDRFFREQHVHVNVTLHFDNLQMIKEAVAHGSGVSILPARAMETEVALGRLVPLPLAAPELFRPVGIVHRRRKHFHRAAKAFLDLLQEQPSATAMALVSAANQAIP